MRVLITGASGLLGSAIGTHLEAKGHQIVRLTRARRESPGWARWDVDSGFVDTAAVGRIDAAVHLAGEGIGDRRWSESHKARVLDSRIRGTRLVAETLASLSPRPEVLISASAVGFYGDRGEEELREQSGPGDDFLADVCRQWEASTAPAVEAGIRVVHTRSGIVFSTRGGALKRLLIPFRLGVGGRLGSGRQFTAWISIVDEVHAIAYLIESQSVRGPVNLVAPEAVRNQELAAALGRVLHRPAFVPAPAIALKLALGELADSMLLASQRVIPARLQESGYEFRHPTLEGCLRVLLDERI